METESPYYGHDYPVVTLKAGRAKSVLGRHPWIFSGGIATVPKELRHGGMARVADETGKIIGTGSYNARSAIALRIFEFREAVIDYNWLLGRIREAYARRRLAGYGPDSPTTGYRGVFGEADGIPGLVVDIYGDVAVLQIATAAMDLKRLEIVDAIDKVYSPRSIVERSDIATRKEEGLEDVAAVHKGEAPGLVTFTERGLKFAADPVNGQKTGFFLDQKELRGKIKEFASGKEALNLFSYSGASAIYAMAGGAKSALNVDSSEAALEQVAQNARSNGMDEASLQVEKADVFAWLSKRSEPAYEMVIMDPPAIIKSAKDKLAGMKAYHFVNRAAMRLVRDGGIFVTSSCSHHLSREEYSRILAKASAQAGVTLHTLAAIGHAADHPVSVYFPEGEYLKSYVFEVRR